MLLKICSCPLFPLRQMKLHKLFFPHLWRPPMLLREFSLRCNRAVGTFYGPWSAFPEQQQQLSAGCEIIPATLKPSAPLQWQSRRCSRFSGASVTCEMAFSALLSRSLTAYQTLFPRRESARGVSWGLYFSCESRRWWVSIWWLAANRGALHLCCSNVSELKGQTGNCDHKNVDVG